MTDSELVKHFEEPSAREVIDFLAEQRTIRGLSQRIVAGYMDTTQSNISELENDRSDPRTGTLMNYARALGLRMVFHLVPLETPERLTETPPFTGDEPPRESGIQREPWQFA